MKKLIPLLVVGFLILNGFGAVGLKVHNNRNEQNQMQESSGLVNIEYESLSLTETIFVSDPNIIQNGQYLTVEINEAESMFLQTGKPMIPVVTKTFSFPAGTIIDDTGVVIDWEQISLSKKITPTSPPQAMTLDPVTFGHERKEFDESVYSSGALYPSEPYTIRTGSGIKDGEHVLYVNVRCNAQYSPANNYIKVPKTIDIDIDYDEPSMPLFAADTYDMIIITHNKFKDQLQRLVNHKNSMGIKTKMVTVDEIYPAYNGVADWEDIKMYLADKVEEWGVDYVLLAGGHKGQTDEWYVPEFLSHNFDDAYAGGGEPYDLTYACDLYYADIYSYDQYGFPVMEDWDTNNNGIYAEGPFYDNFDAPDYYPDVYLGRIPLRYSWEAKIIVDKIIEYDTYANPSWFKKAVLVGGDTSPPARYEAAIEGLYEGEIAASLTGTYLQSAGFSLTKCYTSTNGDVLVREPEDVIDEVNNGCGWVNMQTHSNPALCGNFLPDALKESEFSHFYTIFDVRYFDKGNIKGMYPFLVLDGCHSGQFNVSMQQAISAGGLVYPRSYFLEYSPSDISSWFLLQEGGGGIAGIGVSGLGYGYVDNGITQGLGGWIMPRFAHAYAVQGQECTGELWVQGINDYINIIGAINSDEIDRKTIEERILFGDPSVRLGGGTASSGNDNKDAYDNDYIKDLTYEPTTVNVPTWDKGQEWTYKIHDFDLSLHEVEGRDIDMDLSAGNLNLVVDDVTGDSYKLKYSIDSISGSFDINIDPFTGEEPKTIDFTFPEGTAIQGNIFVEKSSINIETIEMAIDLEFDTQQLLDTLDIDLNLPPILVRFLLPDTIPINANIVLDFDDPYTLIQFPLNVNDEWGIEPAKISIDGTIESKYFRVLNIVNNIFKIFGVELIPEALAKYLPVIDVSEFLTDNGGPTEIDVPELEKLFRKSPFEVVGMKQINVDGGSFNAYDIEFLHGSGELFYSQDAENIVKIEGYLNDFLSIADNIELELISMKG